MDFKLGKQKPVEWIDVEPNYWKPENEGDSVEGVLINKELTENTDEGNRYYIETKEGIKLVWGTTIINSKMPLFKVGDRIKIIYKGMTKNKKQQDLKLFKFQKPKEENKNKEDMFDIGI